MWYTNIYYFIIVYQKYIGTSIKVGCATRSLYASSGPKAEGVSTETDECMLKNKYNLRARINNLWVQVIQSMRTSYYSCKKVSYPGVQVGN